MRKPKKSRQPNPDQPALLKGGPVEFVDEFQEIKRTLDVQEIVEAVRAYRKTKRMSTEEMIREVARCIADDVPYWTVAKRFRPDLPLEKAKVYLRSRVNKKRKEIDAAVKQSQRKYVTK